MAAYNDMEIKLEITTQPGLKDLNHLSRVSTESSVLRHALKGLKFIHKNDPAWARVERRFIHLTAHTNGLLPRSLFGQCIGRRWRHQSEDFTCKLFDMLARKRNMLSQRITLKQLKEFWDHIADKNLKSELQIFFDIVDVDGDGRITKKEVREIIVLCASVNILSNLFYQGDAFAELLMRELDPNNLGYITIRDLEKLLLQGPRQLAWEKGNKKQDLNMIPKHDNLVKRWCRDLRYYLFDNWKKIWVIALWIGVMVGLFIFKYVQYMNWSVVYDVMGHCVCFSEGASETLKLNMAIVLLPVCRNTVTWLRDNTKLSLALPLDDNRKFHKVISVAIALGVGIHGISHLTCGFPRLLKASHEKYKHIKRFFGDQPTSYWQLVTGWQGMTGVIMVITMTVAFTLASSWSRRSRVKLPRPLNKLTGFNSFWYSHHLFILVYVCLIIHGTKLNTTHLWYKKMTWIYLAIPIALYAGERLIRIYRSILAVKLVKVQVYLGDLLALSISKPPGFQYKSGQYIFLNIPAISPFEWHPFYITSAPGHEYISVHIRVLGDWTSQVMNAFTKVVAYQGASVGKDGLGLLGQPDPTRFISYFPKLRIDGPYGASTQHYKNYDVVLLVGLEIGAVSLISVVQDIIFNINAIEMEENDLEEGFSINNPQQKVASKDGKHNFRTKKAYFYWLQKELSSLDWCGGIMNDEMTRMGKKGVLEMHNYITTMQEEDDLYSGLINMLRSFYHARTGIDIVSGTLLRTHFGKPSWRTIYKGVAINHPNDKVGVFCCGSQILLKELRHLSIDFSSRTCTKFEFHKVV